MSLSDEGLWMHHEGGRARSLGEQALLLSDGSDRLVALRRTTAAMQVTLARVIVLRALASIALRYHSLWLGCSNVLVARSNCS